MQQQVVAEAVRVQQIEKQEQIKVEEPRSCVTRRS